MNRRANKRLAKRKRENQTRKSREERPNEKKNAPITRPITALTGDRNLAFPYTSLASRVYPRPTEAQIREQRGKTAALVANDGLTPAQGGGFEPVNEMKLLRRKQKQQVKYTKTTGRKEHK